MVAGTDCQMKYTAGLCDRSHRCEQSHHAIRRPILDAEMHAQRTQSTRVVSQPAEEIEMTHRGAEEIHRGNAIAITVERQRIGHRFDEKMIERHGAVTMEQ